MTRGSAAWVESLRRVESDLCADSQNALLLLHKARCLLALEQRSAALAAAEASRPTAHQDVVALEQLAALYIQAHEEALALEAYDRLLQLAPAHAGALFNRASLRRFTGDLTGAEADYDEVLRLNPLDHEAHLNRSDLRVQTSERNHLAELQQVLRTALDWRSRVQIHYALAKEYEDLCQYENSWQQVSAGASLRRKHLAYDVQHDVETAAWICDAYRTNPVGSPGQTSAAPIFIVGLPRSGSTLIERILGCHSQVASGGERNDFTLCLVEAVQKHAGGKTLTRREFVERSAQLDFSALGESYLRRTRRLVEQRPRFTDKLPLNYLYCGLIHRALPGARIICVSRHPIAVCFAMYKTLFKQGYPFSYDLKEIGEYYLAYRRLMSHWQAALPGVIHEISYESLVANQEAVTHALLQHCGLKFEPNCSAFERNSAPTFTASASQVRRPLYRSATELWKQYEVHLSGLRRQLEGGGILLAG